MNKKIIIGIVIVIVVLGFFFFGKGITGNVIGTARAKMIDDGDSVKFNLDGISRTAEFYDYQGIDFFVVESSGGSVKTAFNACDVCYGSQKGYRQEGNDMICNNCGNHYAIAGLGTKNLKGGGCWPGYLPSTIEGDYLVIKKTDLEAGRYRF